MDNMSSPLNSLQMISAREFRISKTFARLIDNSRLKAKISDLQSISKIQLPNGHITMGHLQINQVFKDCYAKMHTSEYQIDCDEIPNFLKNLSVANFSPELKKKLDEPIRQAEITLLSPLLHLVFFFLSQLQGLRPLTFTEA